MNDNLFGDFRHALPRFVSVTYNRPWDIVLAVVPEEIVLPGEKSSDKAIA